MLAGIGKVIRGRFAAATVEAGIVLQRMRLNFGGVGGLVSTIGAEAILSKPPGETCEEAASLDKLRERFWSSS